MNISWKCLRNAAIFSLILWVLIFWGVPACRGGEWYLDATGPYPKITVHGTVTIETTSGPMEMDVYHVDRRISPPAPIPTKIYQEMEKQLQQLEPETKWLGAPVFTKIVGGSPSWSYKSKDDTPIQVDTALEYEIGLRSDGVVVWRERK